MSNNKSRRIFIDIIFVLLIFYDVIAEKFPMGNYYDEAITILLTFFSIIWIIQNGRLNIINARILLGILIILAIGLISNCAFGYVTSIDIIFRDIVGIFKFFVCFIAANSYMKKEYCYSKEDIIKISKIIICIFFIFGVISLFTDIGMGDSIRFGIRSYKFIYSFYNVLVFNVVILISVLMSDNKNNFIYYLMAFAVLIFTLRTKALIVIALFVVFKIMQIKKNNPIIYGGIISKMKYIIPMILFVFIVTKDKIMTYISFGKYASIRIGALFTGFDIMKDHFPLGSGFGTYGTSLSYSTDSKLYSIYNSINYELMMDPNFGYASMSDTYWPAIYAQIGIIGFIVFIYCMILCFKSIRYNKGADGANKIASMFIMIYMLVVSLTEAIYLNPTGVTGAILIAIVLNMKRVRCKQA